MEEGPRTSAAATDSSTQLAYERTRVAYERTLQAWIRTATSLITFGFSVYKFFQIENPLRGDYLVGPREFGEALVSLGFLALVFAMVDHRLQMRSLREHYAQPPEFSLSQMVAGVLSMLAIFAFVLILLRR